MRSSAVSSRSFPVSAPQISDQVACATAIIHCLTGSMMPLPRHRQVTPSPSGPTITLEASCTKRGVPSVRGYPLIDRLEARSN